MTSYQFLMFHAWCMFHTSSIDYLTLVILHYLHLFSRVNVILLFYFHFVFAETACCTMFDLGVFLVLFVFLFVCFFKIYLFILEEERESGVSESGVEGAERERNPSQLHAECRA